MSIVDEAKKLVEGARREDYGDMVASFERIAGLWSAYLGKEVSRHDVAHMMMLLKISRLRLSPLHHDSLLDVVGYSLCAEQIKGEQLGVKEVKPCC